MFSIRIVTTDHYQAAPLQGLDVCHSDFGHCHVAKVPVIRVFGATPAGQKTCMHVHGVFPYLYVPYDGTQPVDRYTRQFARSVDKALNVALGRASSNQQHVFKVTLVSGMPFYGYHTAEQTFLKIYLYNPSMVKRLADLLVGGAVLNKVFQPYEAHIPYLLQMFIDYNLHGMNMLHVAALKFRQSAEKGSGHWVQSGHPARHVSLSNNDTLMLDSVDDDDDNNGTLQVWNMEDIPQELLVDREVAARQSSCQLEVDVVAADIINRLEIGDTMGTNPGLKALWDDEQQRRRERGEPEEIEIPNSPDRENVSWTRGEAALQERLQQIIYDLQPYICRDYDTDSNVSSGSEDVPVIPSSQVICHTSSAEPNDYSQDTILLEGEDREEGAEEEEGEEPVISEESNSNLRVVSSSQSFQQERPEALDSQDRSLAQLLASLARDSPVCSQSVLEEQDSILSQLLPPGNETESGEEDVESQEMSRCIQQDDLPDLGGMEYSWNSSQWVDVDSPSKGQGWNDGRDINESVIPQLDGPVDEKSDTGAIEQPRKRLGMRGSTISSRRCVRASSHATSPFSFVANTASGMHSSFKASHEVEPFPPPCPPSKKWPSVVVDLRSPPPVQISGNCEMENRIAMKHKKERECSLKQPVGADMNTTSELCEDKCTEEHRPTLVITFKQVPTALTDQESVKHRLRHAKTWTSTIKTTDVFTRLNDTSEKGVGGRKRCEVGKNARTQSNACEHTATKCRGRIRSGDMQQDTCGKDKMRTPTKMRSFSESTVHSRHDNIFQQMKTDFPGPTEPVLTRSLGGDNSHEGLNSEMDSSGDLFDSDQMTSEEHVDNDRGINNVHVPDVSLKCLCDDANITDVQLKPTNGVCSTRAASNNVPLNLGEHIRTYRSGQKSFPPWSPESQFDELVKNKPVTESQKSLLPLDDTGAAATVDKTAGNVMPRLMSPCPVSPGGEKSHTGTLPHLVSQSSNSAPDLSPTEMPVLIDESQSNDLDSLDLFGQWRPRSAEVMSASGGKNPVGTTVSRGGCRVKLPSDHNKGVVISDTARNDELPRLGCQVKLASNNDAGTQISDRTRKGCRVKLPRKASESDRPLSDGVKSTVRMLLPRPACSPQPHNLRSTLPQMNTGSNASYDSDPTATQHTWPVSLADRKLKLSLRKRKRQHEWEVDGSRIQKRENSGTKVITASHFALDDKEKLTLTKSKHTSSNDWHLGVKGTTKRKSPQKKLKSTEADAAWIPKQSIACKDLFDDAKRRKSRLRLPRKSISDGSVRTRDMVAFSAVLPVANYVGGRRLTDVQLVNSQVWVMRSSFKEYDLEKVGNEMLLLQCLKGDDIAELKLQIQQEELHRRKEKRSASTIGVSVDVEHVSDLFDTSAESESELLQQVRIGTEQNTSTGLDASFPSEIEKVENDIGVGSALQSKTDDSSGNGSPAALETEMQDKEEAPIASELTIGNYCKMVVEPKIQHDVKMPSECETENRGIAATEDNMADDEIAPLLSNKTEIHEGSHVYDVQSNTKTMKDTMEEHRSCAVAENKGDRSGKDESETKPVTDDTKAVSESYDTNDNRSGSTISLVDYAVEEDDINVTDASVDEDSICGPERNESLSTGVRHVQFESSDQMENAPRTGQTEVALDLTKESDTETSAVSDTQCTEMQGVKMAESDSVNCSSIVDTLNEYQPNVQIYVTQDLTKETDMQDINIAESDSSKFYTLNNSQPNVQTEFTHDLTKDTESETEIKTVDLSDTRCTNPQDINMAENNGDNCSFNFDMLNDSQPDVHDTTTATAAGADAGRNVAISISQCAETEHIKGCDVNSEMTWLNQDAKDMALDPAAEVCSNIKMAGDNNAKIVGDNNFKTADDSNTTIAGDSSIKTVEDNNTMIAGDSNTKIAEDINNKTAEYSNTKTADDSNIKTAGYISNKTAEDSNTKTAGDRNIKTAGDVSNTTADDSNIQTAGDISNKTAEDSNIKTAGDSNIKTAGDISNKTAEDSNIKTAGDSNIKTAGDISNTTAEDSNTKTAGDSNIKTAGDVSNMTADDSNIKTAGDISNKTAEDSNIKTAGDSNIKTAGDISNTTAEDSNTKTAGDSNIKTAGDISKTTAVDSDAMTAEDSSAVTAEDINAMTAEDNNTKTADDSNTKTADDSNIKTTGDISNTTAVDSDATTAEDSNAVTAEDSNATTAEDSNTKTADDSNIKTTGDISNKTAEDSEAMTTEDSNATTAEDSNATTAEDSNTKTAEDSNTKTAGDSNIKTAGDVSNKTAEDDDATTAEDSNTKTAEDSNATTAEDSNIKTAGDSNAMTAEHSNATTAEESNTKTAEDSNATTAEDSNIKTAGDSSNKTAEDIDPMTAEESNTKTVEDSNAMTAEDSNATTSEDSNTDIVGDTTAAVASESDHSTQGDHSLPDSKPVQLHPVVQIRDSCMCSRGQGSSQSAIMVASSDHMGDTPMSCEDGDSAAVASHEKSGHSRKRGAEEDDSLHEKRLCSRSHGDYRGHSTESGHRSGSEHRADGGHRTTSGHTKGTGHNTGSRHRENSGHRSGSEHRSSESKHRSESEQISESEYRSGSGHRSSGSGHRSSGSKRRLGSGQRSESEHRSGSGNRSGSGHRSSGSEHKSSSSRHKSSDSGHRSSSSRHRSSGSGHRSSDSGHRSSSSRHRSSDSGHRSSNSRHKSSDSGHRSSSSRHRSSGSGHRSPDSGHRSSSSRHRSSGSGHRSSGSGHKSPGSEHRSSGKTHRSSGSGHKSVSEHRSSGSDADPDCTSPCSKRLKAVSLPLAVELEHTNSKTTTYVEHLEKPSRASLDEQRKDMGGLQKERKSVLMSEQSLLSTVSCKKGIPTMLLKNLSELHEKTVENLGGTVAPFSTNAVHQVAYTDALYKMAFLSPAPLGKGNTSPPVAVSPTPVETSMKADDATLDTTELGQETNLLNPSGSFHHPSLDDVNKNNFMNSTEAIVSLPGGSTKDTYDIYMLPSLLPSAPPLLREQSPRNIHSDGSVSPTTLSDDLSPPQLILQSATTTVEGEMTRDNQENKVMNEAKTLSSRTPSVTSEGSVLFSSCGSCDLRGSTVVSGATEDSHGARDGRLQWEDTNNVNSCCCGPRDKCTCGNISTTKHVDLGHDASEIQDCSSHSVVASDDEMFSLSPGPRLHGPSEFALTSVQSQSNVGDSGTSADVTSDVLSDTTSDVGLQKSDGLQILQNSYGGRPAHDSHDSQSCNDGHRAGDSHDSRDIHPTDSSEVSDDGHPVDGVISDTGHSTTGSHLPQSSDSQHSTDDDHLDGAVVQSQGVIITPAVGPPSRETVTADCDLLSGVQLKEPYCSDPCDVPDKPRQVGGRSLRVKSTMVSDLPEFESSFQGLRSWQTAMLSCGVPLDSSFDLAAEMENNPQLLAAAIGDDNVVLTPCTLPPSRQSVQHWLTCRDRCKEKVQEVKDMCPASGAGDSVDTQALCGSDSEVFIEIPQTGQTSTETFGSSTRTPSAREKTRPTSSSLVTSTPITRQSLDRALTTTSQTPIADASDNVIGCTPSDLAVSTLGLVVASTPIRKPSLIQEDVPACTPIAKVLSQNKGDIDCTPPAPPENRMVGRRRRSLLRMWSTEADGRKRETLFSTQLKKQFSSPQLPKAATSQIDGPTLRNSFGFKVSMHDLKGAKAVHEFQYITVMSCELHIETRGDRRPDPEFDSICALFYAITNDIPKEKGPRELSGVIVLDPESSSQLKQSTLGGTTKRFDPNQPSTSKAANENDARLSAAGSHSASANESVTKNKTFQTLLQRSGVTDTDVTYVETETELFNKLVELVDKWDPDVLVGYEIQMLSWGYILKRASKLDIKLCPRLSRLPGNERENTYSAEKDEYGADHMSEIHIAGRITLNLWRILRHQVTLNVYTFENIAYHVLHRRIPLYSLQALTAWFRHRTHLHRWQTIEHYMTRARGNLEIMEQLDVIGQTSEFARVFGIEFYNVLSRGTQYRVESMMLRIAKPLNFIPVSPSVQQRAHMRAPECIPLTLEPESQFYTDPVIVLDFQSLYPSIMIAYNYCFSSCLGRLEHLANAQNGAFDFGCTSLTVPPTVLKKMKDDITISPVGVAFVKQHVRKGILPSMLEDILKTRLMVKAAMKKYKANKTLQRLLHARQLSLKLIANVTYGYTSANFSGRMPSIEVGDSVVSKGRETLERAIELVETTPKWKARVVYGDTDSLFVLLKGRTKQEAFEIGQDMADAVTALNPKPVKLKFEKVYLPCILQTKKRYVGFMYETPDQKEPVFDAKGIETVRRDSCAAVSKVLERSIKQLFTTSDISLVKAYVQTQCRKLLEGHVSMQDCIFAKEYRGLAGYKPTACVPALEIARRLLSKDHQAEPRVGQRVPYVIVHGTPGLPLIQLVRQPQELLLDPELRLNGTYYVTKQVLPPLARVFSLIGIDVFAWYTQLPKTVRVMPPAFYNEQNKKGTISQYFTSLSCPVCEEVTNHGMCDCCRRDPQRRAVVLSNRIRHAERALLQISQICASCMSIVDASQPCVSLDCPVLYRHHRASGQFNQVLHLEQLKTKLLQF